jgi:hypothetical protein
LNGQVFVGWSGDASGSANPLTVQLNGSMAITANFGEPVTMTTAVLGSGTVALAPVVNIYTNGQIVTLTAQALNGQVFVGWSGDASGYDNPLTVFMDDSKVITASFAPAGFVAGTGSSTPEGFRFTLLGEVGARYQIDWGTDLQAWAWLTTVTNTAPFVEIVDRESKPFPRRFYRFKRLD